MGKTSMKSNNFLSLVAAFAALSFSVAAPLAVLADGVHVRGTVVELKGSMLTVNTREGPIDVVTLKDGWKLSAVARAAVDEIKPGDFVGITSLPKAAGGDGAVAVVVLPTGVKGRNEGSFPWDLKPHSTMTNATVSNAVKDVDGNTLTVAYNGQEEKISVPVGTPVVTLAPADQTALIPGAIVFVPAERTADGVLISGFVVVGANGIVPPM
jgi:hypothetical protein